jgi:hypothetical protein
MRSIKPTRAWQRQVQYFFLGALPLVALGTFFVFLGIALYGLPFVTDADGSTTIYEFARVALLVIGAVAIIVGVMLGLRGATRRQDNALALLTADALAAHLDDSYTLVRNINRFGGGYIDGVLVGRPGVLVLRLLDWEGNFLNEGGNWVRSKNGHWLPTRINPTKQLEADIETVRNDLLKEGIENMPIYGAVVLIRDDPYARLTLKNPKILAAHLSSLYARLQKTYLAADRIDSNTVRQVVRVLLEES